jgi:hypothetical protein
MLLLRLAALLVLRHLTLLLVAALRVHLMVMVGLGELHLIILMPLLAVVDLVL